MMWVDHHFMDLPRSKLFPVSTPETGSLGVDDSNLPPWGGVFGWPIFFGAFAVGPFKEGLPSPKTNGWLEDEISYWEGLFSGDMLVLRRVY